MAVSQSSTGSSALPPSMQNPTDLPSFAQDSISHCQVQSALVILHSDPRRKQALSAAISG